MSTELSPVTHDRLHRLQAKERRILKRYGDQLDNLERLSRNASSESVRVQAHRTLLEYVIKPLKEQLLEQRRAKIASAQSALPASITMAIQGLPVGATASVLVTNQGQHNVPLSEVNADSSTQQQVIDVQSRDVPVLSSAPREAAEMPPPASTDAVVPPDFSPKMKVPKDAKMSAKMLEVAALRRSVKGQPRVCLKCGADISGRHHKAMYCYPCMRKEQNRRSREWWDVRNKKINENKVKPVDTACSE